MSWTRLLAPTLAALAVVMLAVGRRPTTSGSRRRDGSPGMVAAVHLPRWWPRRRSEQPDDLAIAEWCEHVARCLRGGHSLPRSIDDAALAVPVGAREFDDVRQAVRRGRSLSVALTTLSPEPSHPVALVLPVLRACTELGGPAAAPLDRVAATLQARAAARAERATASAQARMSARVLTTLPVAMLALLAAADGAVRTTLGTPAGMLCLTLGGTCNVGGWWWMRRITSGGGS